MKMRRQSVAAAKKRLRNLRRELERLDGELQELLQALPCPNREEFKSMLSLEVPLTPEASLLGSLQWVHFHLAEAHEILLVALAITPKSLRSDWQRKSFPLEVIRSIGDVVAERACPTGQTT